jgi:hypothetical protein
MSIKPAIIIPFLLLCQLLTGQASVDPWINAQLGPIMWQETYKGVLADYHPITLVLASDHQQVAGYLIHDGDQRQHKLIGDWCTNGHFQLQEHDQYDRLSGYLNGAINIDQVQMEWISADQTRLFDVKAFPERLIKINSFKPAAEWIEIPGTPTMYLSVQKMDFGIISGVVNLGGQIVRFDGNCMDGTCSIWNGRFQDTAGLVVNIQMLQKDASYYKATINGEERRADIKFVTPLAVRKFDNSTGFLDFVYPQLDSKIYEQWLDAWVDTIWTNGIDQLALSDQPEIDHRLVYRSSGWIEILDEGESYVSGMITYINWLEVRRDVFLWLKKEDQFIHQDEWINTPEDIQRGSVIALDKAKGSADQEFEKWLQKVGYKFMVPTLTGVAMVTEFDMVYGDEIRVIPVEEGKAMIKRKYWRYFGW